MEGDKENDAPPASRSPTPHFKHERLEDAERQIRLLEFLPGSKVSLKPHEQSSTDENTITCKLETCDPEYAPPYAAISYVWADPTRRRCIKVMEASFEVTENCFSALSQALVLGSIDSIWIDSICINQADKEEKGHQVQQMGDIYAHAPVVYVCVGPHDEYSMALCGHTSEIERTSPLSLSKEFHHFEKFANRTYWTRLWIVQEVRLAKTLLMLRGDTLVDNAALARLEGTTSSRRDRIVNTARITELGKALILYPEGPHQRTTSIRAEMRSSDPHIHLIEALYRFRKHGCTDFRDHLYGLLRIIQWPPTAIGVIKPDYTLSKVGLLQQLASIFSGDKALLVHKICYEEDLHEISVSFLQRVDECVSAMGALRSVTELTYTDEELSQLVEDRLEADGQLWRRRGLDLWQESWFQSEMAGVDNDFKLDCLHRTRRSVARLMNEHTEVSCSLGLGFCNAEQKSDSWPPQFFMSRMAARPARRRTIDAEHLSGSQHLVRADTMPLPPSRLGTG